MFVGFLFDYCRTIFHTSHIDLGKILRRSSAHKKRLLPKSTYVNYFNEFFITKLKLLVFIGSIRFKFWFSSPPQKKKEYLIVQYITSYYTRKGMMPRDYTSFKSSIIHTFTFVTEWWSLNESTQVDVHDILINKTFWCGFCLFYVGIIHVKHIFRWGI